MINFQSMIMMMERMGIADVLLPFMLIFCVLFIVLNYVKILQDTKKGDKVISKKKFRTVIALVMSLATVFPHVTNSYPTKYDVVNIINQSLPNVSLIIIGVLMVFIMFGVMGVELNMKNNGFIPIAFFFFAAGSVFYIFATNMGWNMPNIPLLNNPDTQAFILMIAVFGGIIAWVMAPDKSERKGKYKYFPNGFGPWMFGMDRTQDDIDNNYHNDLRRWEKKTE